MNIGIICSSKKNLFTSTLISKLLSQNFIPVCVIYIEKPLKTKLINHIKNTGYQKTLRKILEQLSICRPKKDETEISLRKYSETNRLYCWDSSISDICKENDIEFINVRNINLDSTIIKVKNRRIDVLLNTGADIIRNSIIQAVNVGVLNAHTAFIPTFRGYGVMEWSLYCNHKIGVTLHFIDAGIDTGDIIHFKEIPVEKGDSLETLRAKVIPINIDLMLEFIPLLAHGKIHRVKQQIADGKQYFNMHPRLKAIVEKKLSLCSTNI